ncbi:MAG: ABC transporter ATP-binding protein [Anaerolineae bacterium]|nr:ABC transporter ATP-binding protein [Anaerolineae bacterium]
MYAVAPLLSGVSFAIERGEIACLLGPSGSGKTTLLRIIAGLEAPEKGSVWLEASDLTSVPTHRRGVVLMFQDYALFPHRTVAENVAFGIRDMRYGKPVKLSRGEIARRVAEMLALVGLEGFGDRDVNQLSGGEQQRVALARSLAPQPRLLLLDEPLGALDRTLRERLLEELPVILRRVGVTAITVTHDQEEAFALADRVILLHEGRVIQSGSPEAVYTAPRTAWVARFLGLDNLLPAIVSTQIPPQVVTPCGQFTLESQTPLPAPGTVGMLLIYPTGIHLAGRNVGLSRSPLQGGGDNAFSAIVSQRLYHGRTYAITLAAKDGYRLHCIQTIGDAPVAVGQTITGWVEPGALRWLDS